MNALTEAVIGAVSAVIFLLGTSMIDVSDPVVVGAGGTLLAALTGAVKVLWDRNNALSKATDAALEKCETEHKRAAERYDADNKTSAERMNVLIQQVISLSSEVGMMKGRIIGFQEATDKAEAIARENASHQH
jgi:hypothetical protein